MIDSVAIDSVAIDSVAIDSVVIDSVVIDSVAIGVGRICLVCALVMAAGFVISLLLPERPLRTRAGLSGAMEECAAGGGQHSHQSGLRHT